MPCSNKLTSVTAVDKGSRVRGEFVDMVHTTAISRTSSSRCCSKTVGDAARPPEPGVCWSQAIFLASGILVGLDGVTRNDTTWHVHVALKDATVGVSGSVVADCLALEV